MSARASDAIQELRRMVSDQNRIIFNLRSQLIDQRAVVLQNLARIEQLECFTSNDRAGRGNFRLRYSPMAAVELTLLGQRLEDRARRHRMAIGATASTSTSNGANGVGGSVEGGAANNENDFSTPRTSRVPLSAITNVPADQNAQGGNVSGDGNVPSFGATIETHMERSRRRLLHDEMVQRSVQQHFQHQQQQIMFQAQQQEQRRVEMQRQFDEAEHLQEEIQAADERQNDQQNDQEQEQEEENAQHAAQQQFERTVRLQLRESQRFYGGSPSSVLVPPVQLFWETECVICTTSRPHFYSKECGHIYLCSECAVTAVINKVRRCMLCRASVSGIYPFVR